MPFDKTDTETQPEIDVEAAAADISSDLFGQGGKEGSSTDLSVEGEKETASGPDAVEKASSPQPKTEKTETEKVEAKTDGTADEETSAEVQAIGAPKTWTKAALEKWAMVDPVVQAEIAKREEDFLKGITQYKEKADLGDRYDKVVEPFRPILAAENIDPVQLFQSFSANHYLLSRGTMEQKIQLCANLVSGYGIDFAALSEYIGNADTSAPDPEIVALRRELAEIKGNLTQRQSAEVEATRTQIAQEIDSFGQDAAHPHFNEVAEDMARLVETGLATSLQEAYDKAVYANPVTRQKEIDRLIAERSTAAAAEEQARKDKRAKSTADHVDTMPHSRDGTIPVGTMEETLEATLRDIQSRA